MNTSAALRLLDAANNDAVLASWAAVFDEHRMSPECDVSPYDCWEVLQGFLSNGVLSPSDYNSVNLKQEFFAGTRPSTHAIQAVLARLACLRANHPSPQEFPVSNAPRPMSAFEAFDVSISPSAPRQAPTLRTQAPAPQFAATDRPAEFAAFQRAGAPTQAFRDQPAPNAFGAAMEETKLPCRTLDAKLYRDSADVDISMLCKTGHASVEVHLYGDDEDIVDDGEVDGESYAIHEYMAHGECSVCGMIFHSSASRSIPSQR